MVLLLTILSAFISPSVDKNPVELGKVNWIRNYDQALALSAELDKPIFILFQEVPGCSTCKNYGQKVLSHPFIVEAIEDEFIPLAIYNNKAGKDKKVLEKYNEPTWNNPVVRIVNENGDNIVRRLYSNYSLQGVTNSMINALLESNKIVPDYLHLFKKELDTNQGTLKESYASMYCFWTGEKVLGSIDGVAETEAGFMDGKEVVRFKYNPKLVKYEELIKTAGKMKCADAAYTDDAHEREIAEAVTRKKAKPIQAYRSDRTPKYYLANTIYQYLPMSSYQSLKINVALSEGNSAIDLLSPRQQALLEYINKNIDQKWKAVYRDDFTSNWWKIYGNMSISS